MTTKTNTATNGIHIPTQFLGALSQIAARHSGPAIDVTDPESLIAYFQAQMTDTRSKLSELMSQQEVRTKRCSALQSAQAIIGQAQESGIKPTDPGWNDFVEALKNAQAILGDSKEGKAIQSLLDKATAPTPTTTRTYSEAEAAALAEKHGTSYSSDGTDIPLYSVTTMEGPGVGFTKAEVTGLLESVKAYSGALQAETPMAMIRVQQLVESSSQIVNVCSNTLKKVHEMVMAPIGNLR